MYGPGILVPVAGFPLSEVLFIRLSFEIAAAPPVKFRVA
jgi:hypothetical protein